MSVPVFVRIDEYDEVRSTVESIKEKLAEAKLTLEKINQLREEENNEIDSWKIELSNVESKIGAIDKELSKPDQGGQQ